MMQQHYAASLLRSGIIEARAGEWAAALRYLERAVFASNNSRHDTMKKGLVDWLADILDG